ncbi:MAG: DUF1634 domain-containing protein [Sinobacteraceae bacterium]|nr:DUF1634 domain-containing protein [Nevskiaceae bacterium]
MSEAALDEWRLERRLGVLLRAGVLAAAFVVLIGAALLLWHHGTDRVSFARFAGEPSVLRHPLAIAADARRGSGRGLIQLGLLLLIATPVARVAFAALAFWRVRDRWYLGVTLWVLAVLGFSLLGTR